MVETSKKETPGTTPVDTSINNTLNDLLQVLIALDSRVKKLETLHGVKRYPSYLRVVLEVELKNCQSYKDVWIEQTVHLLNDMIADIKNRIEELEES